MRRATPLLLALCLGLAADAAEPTPKAESAPMADPAPMAESAPKAEVPGAAQTSGTSVPLEQVKLGEALYTGQICSVCHSNDGSRRAAPSFKGLYGSRQQLRDGTEVVVDEAYLRESILNPGAKVAKGFQPLMPPYEGRLSPQELEALLTYIQSLR